MQVAIPNKLQNEYCGDKKMILRTLRSSENGKRKSEKDPVKTKDQMTYEKRNYDQLEPRMKNDGMK